MILKLTYNVRPDKHAHTHTHTHTQRKGKREREKEKARDEQTHQHHETQHTTIQLWFNDPESKIILPQQMDPFNVTEMLIKQMFGILRNCSSE